MERMTLNEYNLRMRANSLKHADELEKLAQLALYIRRAKTYDEKSGVYDIQKVSDLVDVDKLEKEIFDDPVLAPDVFNKLNKIAKNLCEYRARKGGDE